MTTTGYEEFLQTKRLVVPSVGKSVDPETLNPALFPFQRQLVAWALKKGRSAIFADTGLGKTLMQLSWAEHAAERTLILAPLAVALQTAREGAKFGIPVKYARAQAESAERGITVTNYEMMLRFDLKSFGAVVIDESSILKNFEGKIRARLIHLFQETPYRLCCTATPAPNDIAEIANHAEFLGIMTRAEMLAAFFVHDDAGWRLKGHARDPFYRWLASWGMSLKRPSDLGFSDEGYDLPPLSIVPHFLPVDYAPAGKLFADRLQGVTERASVRRETLSERVDAAAELIRREAEPWIAWVGLNDEGQALAKHLGSECVLVEGNQSPEEKAAVVERFLQGEVRVMVTKPSIAGHGLNLQHCARMVFVGLSDSYEQYYQCIRRCYRFGQDWPVTAHIVLTEPERTIHENILKKEREAETTARELVKNVAEFERQELGRGSERDKYSAMWPMALPEWIRTPQ